MPKYTKTQQFLNDWKKLSPAEQRMFLDAVKQMVEDIRAKRPFASHLRIKGVQKRKDVFEMTWEYHNGRATFEYGLDGMIVWRRIGDHNIFNAP